MKKLFGWTLLSLPLTTLIGFMLADIGILGTIGICAAAVLAVGAMLAGASLIDA